ncbi:MAG: dicarboxylate/amino acid:cation symporter, partial [Muribaculaceae bacterium]|nr:dicarboxylate/amino acid:cation symporter [Muribaculaceae bacterium]
MKSDTTERKPFYKRIGLLGYILAAIVAGVCAGWILPDWAIRIPLTFNALFSQFLGFIIPLLILGLVAPAIVEIGKGAGRMLLFTVVLAYVATLGAGILSYFTGVTFFPHMIQPEQYIGAIETSQHLEPYFTITMQPLMTVTSALVLAFVLGLTVASFSTDYLKNVLLDFRQVIVSVIRSVIVPLLPLYIFGIFAEMTNSGQVVAIVSTFLKVIGVIFALHFMLLFVQYLIGGWIGGRNPFRCMKLIIPAYLTALGTASSAATIP